MINVPVPVKDALREGNYKKNYRIVVLSDGENESFIIDNNNLIKESVSIDERMVSGDTLKFGLCEGSSLEFQYFGKDNITGRQLQVFCDVNYEDAGTELTQNDSYTVSKAGNYEILVPANTPRFDIEYQPDGGLTETIRVYSFPAEQTVPLNNCGVGDVVSFSASSDISVTLRGEGGLAWCEIPMGYFTVKNCSRQASTGIIKVTAYNKLQSEYLDAKVNELIKEIPSNTVDGTTTLYCILQDTLKDYGIIEKPKEYISLNIGQATTGGDGVVYTSLSFNYNNHTYHPALGSVPACIARNNGYLSKIKVLHIEQLNEYINILKSVVNALKTSIYQRISNADEIWEGMKDSGFRYCGLIVNVYVDTGTSIITRTYYYTLSELINENTPSSYRPIENMPIDWWNAAEIQLNIPYFFEGLREVSSSTVDTVRLWTGTQTLSPSLFDNLIYIVDGSEYSDAELIAVDTATLPDVTLRELQSAVYETVCEFGQLSRETDLFSGVELNHSRLLPADTLYPADDLYPDGAQESAFKSQYSKLWADEGNIHKWRYLIITYKGLDENQVAMDFELQVTVNEDGTDDYIMSDNWLFKNLIWTEAQVTEYAAAMIAKMQDITWFPFEMWAAGLPYLETGDEIEIPLGGETYTSYILQRQLKGIQNLQDTFINGTLDIF